jgi:hypothetical protein
MRHGGRAVGALHFHARGDATDLPALHGRNSILVHDESRDARLFAQRFVWVTRSARVVFVCTYAMMTAGSV